MLVPDTLTLVQILAALAEQAGGELRIDKQTLALQGNRVRLPQIMVMESIPRGELLVRRSGTPAAQLMFRHAFHGGGCE